MVNDLSPNSGKNVILQLKYTYKLNHRLAKICPHLQKRQKDQLID